LSREQRVAVAVFDGVDGNRNEIADLDFNFALVVLEFRRGYASTSDRRSQPWLCSMRTTSAVMASPERISERSGTLQRGGKWFETVRFPFT
jgi:hypothetical protein